MAGFAPWGSGTLTATPAPARTSSRRA